jgi:hypothetical protein
LRTTGAERRSVACQQLRPHVAGIAPRYTGRSTDAVPTDSSASRSWRLCDTNLQFSLTKFDGRRLAVCLHGRSVFSCPNLASERQAAYLAGPATDCGIELSRLCAVLQVGPCSVEQHIGNAPPSRSSLTGLVVPFAFTLPGSWLLGRPTDPDISSEIDADPIHEHIPGHQLELSMIKSQRLGSLRKR